MNRTTVFSKTGKALLEMKANSSKLPKDQLRVLNLVDGKATLRELTDKTRITENELRTLIAQLEQRGYLKEVPASSANQSTPAASSAGLDENLDDLDFTRILAPGNPAKPAAPQTAFAQRPATPDIRPAPPPPDVAKARHDADQRARDEATLRDRAEAERKAREEQAQRHKLEAELRARAEAEERAKEENQRKARAEAERQQQFEAEALSRIEAERRRLQQEQQYKKETASSPRAAQGMRDLANAQRSSAPDRHSESQPPAQAPIEDLAIRNALEAQARRADFAHEARATLSRTRRASEPTPEPQDTTDVKEIEEQARRRAEQHAREQAMRVLQEEKDKRARAAAKKK